MDCFRIMYIRFTEPTNMLDIRAILWLEDYLQVGWELFVFSHRLKRSLDNIFLPQDFRATFRCRNGPAPWSSCPTIEVSWSQFARISSIYTRGNSLLTGDRTNSFLWQRKRSWKTDKRNTKHRNNTETIFKYVVNLFRGMSKAVVDSILHMCATSWITCAIRIMCQYVCNLDQ